MEKRLNYQQRKMWPIVKSYNRSILLITALICANFALATPLCDTCPRDQHGRIERSAHAKAEFKRQHPCPSTGKRSGACKGYVIDHIVALKRGGADNPDNMQWQTTAEAKTKDKWE